MIDGFTKNDILIILIHNRNRGLIFIVTFSQGSL